MKAQKQVISGQTNGTLTMNRKKNTLRRLLSLLLLVVASFAAMSFQKDDTTKSGDRTSDVTAFTTFDSCCTVTILNGNQRITITRISAIKSYILINDMDVQTWVNGLEAYTFKKLNTSEVTGADVDMDAEFTAAELQNRQQAALFSRSMGVAATEADEQLTDMFMLRVGAPAFGNQLQEELNLADATMDAQLITDEVNKQEAARFRKTVIEPAADELMDMAINASVLKNFTAAVALDADQLMDAQMNKAAVNKFEPADLQNADQKMDEQIRK